MSAFREMIARFAKPGRLDAILLRAERLAPPHHAEDAWITGSGLEGDHGRAGKRAVTLLQAEHLPVIAAVLGAPALDPATLRRNLIVSGVNLNALRDRRIAIGGAVLEITGICAPCSRMEEALGQGGYSAMRGHGGWCATVIDPGKISLGDTVRPLDMLAADQA